MLVPVYQGGQDVEGAADKDGEQEESDQGLLGSVEQSSPGSCRQSGSVKYNYFWSLPSLTCEALTLTEEVGEWKE